MLLLAGVMEAREQLPWEQIFRDEYRLDRRSALTAADISGLRLDYAKGTRAGLWGLTPYVARHYGLVVNSWQDERYDLGRATRAAALYIKDLIRASDGDTLRALDAFVNTPLVRTTDSLYICPSFMDVTLSARDRALLDSAYAVTDEQRALELVLIEARREQLRAEQLRQDSIAEAARLRAIAEANATRIHTVVSGETLGHIARRYHCSVAQIKQWNGLRSDLIRIGQKLKIKHG